MIAAIEKTSRIGDDKSLGFRLVREGSGARMPEMDGLQATRAIRAREASSGSRVPIVATTAHAMKGDEERCLRAGMDGEVANPVRPRDHVATVENGALRSLGSALAAEPGGPRGARGDARA